MNKACQRLRVEGWQKGKTYGVKIVGVDSGHVYRANTFTADCEDDARMQLAGAMRETQDRVNT